jgi:hypothetical protein
MENRNEILKSIGFSDDFLKALAEFEKSVPNVYYDIPFDEKEYSFTNTDSTDQLIISHSNDDYSHNIVVTQPQYS